MDQVRCVIANMPQKLLADIVERMVVESGDIQVIDRANNLGDIEPGIDRESIDLIVLGMQSISLPQSCVEIMNEIPNLTIIGLVDDGRRLACFLDNVGKNDILKIIHTFCHSGREPGEGKH